MYELYHCDSGEYRVAFWSSNVKSGLGSSCVVKAESFSAKKNAGIPRDDVIRSRREMVMDLLLADRGGSAILASLPVILQHKVRSAFVRRCWDHWCIVRRVRFEWILKDEIASSRDDG